MKMDTPCRLITRTALMKYTGMTYLENIYQESEKMAKALIATEKPAASPYVVPPLADPAIKKSR